VLLQRGGGGVVQGIVDVNKLALGCVRGSSPLPSSCLHSTSHAPVIRPMEPPYIPPNIHAAIDSHR